MLVIGRSWLSRPISKNVWLETTATAANLQDARPPVATCSVQPCPAMIIAACQALQRACQFTETCFQEQKLSRKARLRLQKPADFWAGRTLVLSKWQNLRCRLGSRTPSRPHQKPTFSPINLDRRRAEMGLSSFAEYEAQIPANSIPKPSDSVSQFGIDKQRVLAAEVRNRTRNQAFRPVRARS